MVREDVGPVTVTIEGAIPEDIRTPGIEQATRARLGLRPQDTVIVRRV
jgi:hypothetical protein